MVNVKKFMMVFLAGTLTLTLYAKNRTVDAMGIGNTLETAVLNAQRRAVIQVLRDVIRPQKPGKEIIKATLDTTKEFIVSSEVRHSTDKYLPNPRKPNMTKHCVTIKVVVDADKIKAFAARMQNTPGKAAPAESAPTPAPEMASAAPINIPHRTVEAEGVGETVEKALYNARRNAVRKAFGEVVDSTVEINNEKLDEAAVSASSGFIMSYEKLGEPEPLPGNAAYKVKIRAVVATEKLGERTIRPGSATNSAFTVEAEGVGKTVEKAMADARRNAVRKAFGEVVDSVAELRNEKLLESTISASSGFIVSTEALGEPEYSKENSVYKVKIRAAVSADKVKDHINRFKSEAVKTDTQSLLNTATDAETQGKNVIAALLDFNFEAYKTLKASEFKYSLHNGSLVLETGFTQDRNRFEELKAELKRKLLANGYRIISDYNDPILRERSAGGLIGFKPEPGQCPRCNRYKRKICISREHCEFYYNLNVNIVFNEHPATGGDPRNIFARLGNTEIRFRLVHGDDGSSGNSSGRRSGKRHVRTIRGRRDNYFIDLSHHGIFISNANEAEANEPLSCYLNGEGRKIETSYKMTPKLKNVTAAELIVVCERPNDTLSATIGRIPVNIGNILAQQESMDDRGGDYAKLVANYVREFNKTLIPKAKVEYDNRSGGMKLTMDFSVDKRGFLSTLRKMESQFEKLGIMHNREGARSDLVLRVYNGNPKEVLARRRAYAPIPPPARRINGVMVRPPTPPRPPDNWPRHLRIPDGERKISKAVYEQCGSRKLRYVFVVRLKDAAGDVLKTLKIPMPTREVMPVTVWNGEIEIAMLSSHMEIPISSNIDIKNIRDIEYVIEERVTNTN